MNAAGPNPIGWRDDPWDDPHATREWERQPPDLRAGWPIVRIAVVIVVAVSLMFGAAGLMLLRFINPPGGADTAVNFTVNDGDDLAAVSRRLEEQGFISSAAVFRWYVAREGGVELEPGYYLVVPRSHMGDIRARLSTPPAATFVSVTFPEGFTAAQMGERLADRTLRLDADQFVALASNSDIETALRPDGVQSLEGLLFPDTYQVSGDENESRVITRMVRLMERVGRQEGIESSVESVGLTPYEVLIVASMIEREAKLAEDRPKIARVIYNRLAIRMSLQIDATLYYGAPEGLTFTELKAIDSPYNTYLRTGLPPTPIANPGRASIAAALNPAPNPPAADPVCAGITPPCRYLYYVLADREGGHVFAASLAQHEANVARARAEGVLP